MPATWPTAKNYNSSGTADDLLNEPFIIRFGYPTEAPAKAGVWGWVKLAYAAQGREQRRSDLNIRVKNAGT